MISQNKIDIEKKIVISKCKKCGGKGCGICFGFCSYIDKMAESGIPVDYWHRKMEDFYGDQNFKKLILDYLNNIDLEYSKGINIFFSGHRGTGKTMAACSILKKAITRNYISHYTTMVDAVDSIISEKYYRNIIKFADFLVIDEVDQRFFPSPNSRELYGNQFEYILRTRSQNRLPTIMCTNSEDLDEIFSGQFKESFKSLKSQFIKMLRPAGKDARLGKEKYNG